MTASVKPRGAKRIEIIEKAKVFFRSKGYDRVSIKDIAIACDCTQGNIYNHFPSKEAILYEIFQTEISQLLMQIRHLEYDEEMDPIDQFNDLIRTHLRHNLTSADGYFINFEMEMEHLSPERRQTIVWLRDEVDNIVRKVMQRCITKGVFRPIDVGIARFVITSAVARSGLWFSPKGRLSVDEIADRLCDIFINGLIAKPLSPPDLPQKSKLPSGTSPKKRSSI